MIAKVFFAAIVLILFFILATLAFFPLLFLFLFTRSLEEDDKR